MLNINDDFSYVSNKLVFEVLLTCWIMNGYAINGVNSHYALYAINAQLMNSNLINAINCIMFDASSP